MSASPVCTLKEPAHSAYCPLQFAATPKPCLCCPCALLLATYCRYLMAPMQQLQDELKEDVSGLGDVVKRLTQQQQHAAKALAATEAEVQELFKSSPELTRQLMPASS